MLRAISRTPLIVVLTALALSVLPLPVSATWSIIAVDSRSGLVVIASATCVTAEGLRARGGLKSIQAVIVPGMGVAAAQAGVDGTRANQTLIYEEMRKGTDPDVILEMLSADENFQRRQFGFVDLQGRMGGFSGANNGYAALAVQSEIRDEGIYFAVQGNILESRAVVLDAVAAILDAEGTVVDRVMAGMEAADEAGGDSRCSCRSETVPETEAGCRHRTAHVAYIAAAKPEDALGDGHSDGDYSLFIDGRAGKVIGELRRRSCAPLREHASAHLVELCRRHAGLYRVQHAPKHHADDVPDVPQPFDVTLITDRHARLLWKVSHKPSAACKFYNALP